MLSFSGDKFCPGVVESAHQLYQTVWFLGRQGSFVSFTCWGCTFTTVELEQLVTWNPKFYDSVLMVQDITDSSSICSTVLCIFQMEKKNQEEREKNGFSLGRLVAGLVPTHTGTSLDVMCN
jgi:hypothetical protein